jgi:hypothetical protein
MSTVAVTNETQAVAEVRHIEWIRVCRSSEFMWFA